MSRHTITWHIKVPRYADGALTVPLETAPRLKVTTLGREVVIMGDSAGLVMLAEHLLTFAQDGVPSGHHRQLEPGMGLHPNSVTLVLERDDDPESFVE